MSIHRFREQLGAFSQQSSPDRNLTSGGFMVCPMCLGATLQERSVVQQVYQMAYEQAQAVVRPSWLERDVLGVWN